MLETRNEFDVYLNQILFTRIRPFVQRITNSQNPMNEEVYYLVDLVKKAEQAQRLKVLDVDFSHLMRPSELEKFQVEYAAELELITKANNMLKEGMSFYEVITVLTVAERDRKEIENIYVQESTTSTKRDEFDERQFDDQLMRIVLISVQKKFKDKISESGFENVVAFYVDNISLAHRFLKGKLRSGEKMEFEKADEYAKQFVEEMSLLDLAYDLRKAGHTYQDILQQVTAQYLTGTVATA